jgi:alkylhydroperoxidase family enzyme
VHVEGEQMAMVHRRLIANGLPVMVVLLVPFGCVAASEWIQRLPDQKVATAGRKERLPMLTNEEAWKRLPGAPAIIQPLPAWARLLAGPLPLTTARMLELDAMHRTGDRLDPRLRALARWAAADANGCSYGKAVAAADLRRAGFGEKALHALTTDLGQLTPLERAATTFARKMMREAHAVTDEEMKHLLQHLGEERLVALVALLAHASFQDRMFLATNVQSEAGEAPPPLTVVFAKPKPPVQVAVKPANAEIGSAKVKETPPGQEWLGLQKNLDRQRTRTGRIRVPSKEEVLKRIGENHPNAWQADIYWSRVCYGFQPELTEAWFECAAAFRQESGLDRVFTQCIFWVVTQSLGCFY